MISLKEQIDKEGYLVINDVFSSKEIDDIELKVKSAAKSNIEDGLVNDESNTIKFVKNSKNENFTVLYELLSKPELSSYNWIVLNERIIAIVQKLVDGPICYFGESMAQIGEGVRGFHKDNVGRNDPSHSDWSSNYDVFRLGIYLQDTSEYSGGLQVRNKSHLIASRWKGKPINLRLKKGSIIIWKSTLTHSGNTLLPRLFPSFPYLIPRLTSLLPSWLFREYERDRVAIFITYSALKSVHAENYIEQIKYGRDDWHVFNPTKENKEIAIQRNITLRK